MNIISSSLLVNGDHTLKDIHFSSGVLGSQAFDFRYLSIVKTARIPFSVVAGPSCDVWTESEETIGWFAEKLALDRETEGGQSRYGVLIEALNGSGTKMNVTEILLYGSGQTSDADSETIFSLKALPLCSEYLSYLPSPPLSPAPGATELDAQFLPPLEELRSTALSKEKKRKQVSGLFDEATERRRKASRHGGESVSAAASKVNGVNILIGQKKPKQPAKSQQAARPPTNDLSTGFPRPRSRAGSFSASQDQPRRLSRSPSMSSEIRPASRRGPADAMSKRSGLSRMASFSEPTTIMDRNKEAVSRLVMAGMRLYGLQQRKKTGHSRRASEMNAHKPSLSQEPTAAQEDAAKDDEYKLIYHQTYKGTVFAFRKVMATEPLHSNPACLQDTVDKFLAIFCNDPLVQS